MLGKQLTQRVVRMGSDGRGVCSAVDVCVVAVSLRMYGQPCRVHVRTCCLRGIIVVVCLCCLFTSAECGWGEGMLSVVPVLGLFA